MITKEIYKLKNKSFSEGLNWILFAEALQNFPRIDLTYEYRLEFKKDGLYLRDGWKNLLIASCDIKEWIDCLKIFLDRCMKLRGKGIENVEIDFPIVNREKWQKDYSYFFRYNNGKMFLDIREGYINYDKEVYNYKVQRNMKNIMTAEIPMDKIVGMMKVRIEMKLKKDGFINHLNKTIKNIDKQKTGW